MYIGIFRYTNLKTKKGYAKSNTKYVTRLFNYRSGNFITNKPTSAIEQLHSMYTKKRVSNVR